MEAEGDVGEVAVRLRGTLVTCFLFSLRLSFSGKAVHRILLRTDEGDTPQARATHPLLPMRGRAY